MALKINEKEKVKNNNDGNNSNKKKGLTPEEKMKIKQMKELHALVYPNIKDLTQKEPTKLIHEALQGFKYIVTESEGEEPNRCVVIKYCENKEETEE